MSIEISNVTQIDEGGTNPKTELFEQPLWLLEFDTGEQRTIGKPRMEEYLSKAYEKTVHHFKRRISTLTSGTKITQWSGVFTDYDDFLLSTSEERKEIDEHRDKVKEEGDLGDFRDLIRKDALPHPDKTGYNEFPSKKEKVYINGITGEKYTKDSL